MSGEDIPCPTILHSGSQRIGVLPKHEVKQVLEENSR